MSIISFIPARGGSKSIPLKNIKLFCGKPLIYWTLKSLQNSIVDKIVVATDSELIKTVVKGFNFSKIEIYDRKSENAKDDSSTESVMLEYIKQSELLDSDTFMLAQATSPFTQTNNFNEGLKIFEEYDSVLSCTVDKRFLWKEDGFALNYDINNRPRRQDFKGNLIENGAFYINSVGGVKSNRNRISGNIGIYNMRDYTSIEIDERLDWVMAEFIMKKFVLAMDRDFSKIKIFLSDVDGVLTDGCMYYLESGDEFKKFSTHDGMGFRLLQQMGIKSGIITSEDMQLNRRRAQKLKLDFDFHGIKDKLKEVQNLCKTEEISLDNIAYIGDDVNCLELLSNVGISACPSNAVQKIKEIPGIIQLENRGGGGAVREFIQLFLK